MDESRKAWCEKYKVQIANGGFIEKYCIPEHVECVLPSKQGEKPYFIGFDGKSKTYKQLTEEEKQDYQEQIKKMTSRLNEFVHRKDNVQER